MARFWANPANIIFTAPLTGIHFSWDGPSNDPWSSMTFGTSERVPLQEFALSLWLAISPGSHSIKAHETMASGTR